MVNGKMMDYKKKEEGKLKSMPTSDVTAAAAAMTTLMADYGVGPRRRSSYAAAQLKAANKILQRMHGQKQGT